MSIHVHEIEPNVFVRWPSGHPVMKTFTTANLQYADGRIEEVAVDAYEAEIRGVGGDLSPYSEKELEAMHLPAAAEFVVPEGKRIVGDEKFARDRDGNVVQVFAVDDIPAPPEPPRRQVAKSLVLQRLTDAQLEAALGAMTMRQVERWRSPDLPFVYADDQEVIGMLRAIGADPDVVLAA